MCLIVKDFDWFLALIVRNFRNVSGEGTEFWKVTWSDIQIDESCVACAYGIATPWLLCINYGHNHNSLTKKNMFLCSRQTTNSFVFITRKITSITRYCFSKSPIMDQKVLKFPQKKRHDTTGNHPVGSKQSRNHLVFWQLLFVYIHARMHSCHIHADAECHFGQPI